MKILAIDSSGLVASCAVIVDGNLVSEFTVNNKKTHSQTLLPMIDKVVDMSGIELEEMDAIAVAAGPGSFTGLRIGASTAKGVALVIKKPIIPVPTLEGLAFRTGIQNKLICPIMDARRNQVYTGLYKIKEDGLNEELGQSAIGIDELIKIINDKGEEVVFVGDAVPVQKKVIDEELKVPHLYMPKFMCRQTAAAVGALGEIYYSGGKIEDAASHRPIYLRKSQAEREREEKIKC